MTFQHEITKLALLTLYDVAYLDHDARIKNQLLIPAEGTSLLSDASRRIFPFKVPLTEAEKKSCGNLSRHTN
jgi:hypothetical protein